VSQATAGITGTLCAALVVMGAIAPPAARAATTGTWVSVGPMNAERYKASAIVLTGGKVLQAGGFFESSAQIYQKSTGRFTPTGDMWSERASFTLVPLPDGTVLAAGGYDSFDGAYLLGPTSTIPTPVRGPRPPHAPPPGGLRRGRAPGRPGHGGWRSQVR
jgi:hypothetical protein